VVLEPTLNRIRRRRYVVRQRGGDGVARFRRLGPAVELASRLALEADAGARWLVVLERRGRERQVVWRAPGDGPDEDEARVRLGPPRGPLRSDAVALEPPREEEPPDAVSGATA
jgi:hypothetical protein